MNSTTIFEFEDDDVSIRLVPRSTVSHRSDDNQSSSTSSVTPPHFNTENASINTLCSSQIYSTNNPSNDIAIPSDELFLGTSLSFQSFDDTASPQSPFNGDISNRTVTTTTTITTTTTNPNTNNPTKNKHHIPIYIDSTPNTVISFYNDPRFIISIIAIILTILLSFKFTTLYSSNIEFIGARGSNFQFTRGWCIIADLWLTMVMSGFSLFHLIDSFHLYKLYPYRSMGTKQYPGTQYCFNANINMYLMTMVLFGVNIIWWSYTQRELEPEWILLREDLASKARKVNYIIWLLAFLYTTFAIWQLVLVIKMRFSIVTFPTDHDGSNEQLTYTHS